MADLMSFSLTCNGAENGTCHSGTKTSKAIGPSWDIILTEASSHPQSKATKTIRNV